MFDFKITCDNGAESIIRASDLDTAKKLFCQSEGHSQEWYREHCSIRKITAKNKEECGEVNEFPRNSAAYYRRMRARRRYSEAVSE